MRVIDLYEMTSIWNRRSRGMRMLDMLDWHVLIGAVCKDHHWTLVAMYPNERRSLFIDPFGATEHQIKQCRDSTRAFMREKYVNIFHWTCNTIAHPRQQDSTSCGVIICKIAELLLKGEPIIFPANKMGIDQIRREMAHALLDHTDNMADLCRFCGKSNTREGGPSETPMENLVGRLQFFP
ncbi:sentrin-specific protease 2-like isoform 1-T1 [Acanthopagrus schlegelii]